MRNICIIFLTVAIIILTALGFSGVGSESARVNVEYLRLHIRANSNTEEDQWVKYAVKEEISAYLTPLVVEYASREQAVAGLNSNVSGLETVARTALERRGFFYGAKAEVRTEYFPTRVYEEYTLPAGEYLALVIELGEGEGDNWWCVVYPPLCFTAGNGNILYKSKIAEIIRAWKTA